MTITFGNKIFANIKFEKLLRIRKDHELNFNEHVNLMCKTASAKLNFLSRTEYSMTFDEQSFILMHLPYYSLV